MQNLSHLCTEEVGCSWSVVHVDAEVRVGQFGSTGLLLGPYIGLRLLFAVSTADS